MASALEHSASPANLEPTKLISQMNLQRLWAQLDSHVYLTYDDWEKIVTVWFVDYDKRRKTLKLLQWARAGRVRFDPGSDPDEPHYIEGCDPWDADAGPEDPLYCIPGLPDHLKALTLDQIGVDIDELRKSGYGLDVQGYRGSMFHTHPMDAQDVDASAFIRGAKPGKPITVTGNPGDGKTHFVEAYIAAPAARAGWVVISNIKVKNPPKNYIYASTYAKAIAAAIGARLEGSRVMLIRDEGGTNRGRGQATTKEGREQKNSSLQLYRKLDIVEVFVIQLPTDIPREVAATRSHWFHKRGKKGVECSTPTLRGMVVNLQSNAELDAVGRPILDYDHRDPSPFEIDANLVAIINFEYGRRDVAWELHMGAIKERLERIDQSPLIKDPLTLDQLKRRCLDHHLHDTRASPKFFFGFFHHDWLFNGVANTKVLHELFKNEWGMWSHPEMLGKACRYCLGHHPQLRLEAARESAANPPAAPD